MTDPRTFEPARTGATRSDPAPPEIVDRSVDHAADRAEIARLVADVEAGLNRRSAEHARGHLTRPAGWIAALAAGVRDH
jgi:hypothetical protein